MTVQEMLDALSAIENKDLNVVALGDDENNWYYEISAVRIGHIDTVEGREVDATDAEEAVILD